MNIKNCIIKNSRAGCEIYADTCVYSLIKQDLEATQLFPPEEVALAFLTINCAKFDDTRDLIQITHNEEKKSFLVRYLFEVKTKNVRHYIFFKKPVQTQVWEEVLYLVFENKKK